MACDASANSIEAEAIGLCVAFEGLARLLPHQRSPAEIADSDTIRNTVVKWIEKRKFGERVSARACGLMNQLPNPPMRDRLQPLIESGYLQVDHFKAWNKLRNAAVHPSKTTGEDFDDVRRQKMIDTVYQVYVCMYHIVFVIIGYEGKFTNYAADDFPSDIHPKLANMT
jgi:hypothetical protein